MVMSSIIIRSRLERIHRNVGVFSDARILKVLERLNPAYKPPNRVTVAAVADDIAEECLTYVKSILTKHVADGGTICLAADAWTKKCRKFIENLLVLQCVDHADD